MKSALLLGSYGQTNLGDDLLMWNYLSYLRDRGYDRLYANAARADLLPAIITESFADLRVIETYRTSPADWLRILRDVDVIVYGGGTMYKEMYGSTGRRRHAVTLRMAAVNSLARLSGVPVYNLNIGIGTIRTRLGRMINRRGLRASSYTIFRDQQSYDYARRVLKLSADRIAVSTDGLFLDTSWQRHRLLRALPAADARPRIGVNLLSDIPDWVDRAHYLATVRELINKLISDGYAVIGIPFQHEYNEHNDHAFMANEVQPYVIDAEHWRLLDSVQLDTVGSVIAGCDAVIGMRFHSLVLATAIGTPFVGIAYDTKCKRYADEIGYPHMVDIEDLQVPAVGQHLAAVLANSDPIRNRLIEVADSHYVAAERQLAAVAL